jgi:hypothetical protein
MKPAIMCTGDQGATLVNLDDMLRTEDRILFFGGVFLGKLPPGGRDIRRRGAGSIRVVGDPTGFKRDVFLFDDHDGRIEQIAEVSPRALVEIPHGKVRQLELDRLSQEAAKAMLRVVGKPVIATISLRWDKGRGHRNSSADAMLDQRVPLVFRDLHLAYFWDGMIDQGWTFRELAEFLSSFPWWSTCTESAVKMAANRLGLKKRQPKRPDPWEEKGNKK